MNKDILEHRNCMLCNSKADLFKYLTESELELIDQNRITVYYKKGETIRKQGSSLTHVISISRGLAKVYLEGPNNKNVIMAIASPSFFIGGSGMFVDRKHHFSVAAITEACVCFIELKIFKDLLRENVLFAEAYFKHKSLITLSAYNRLINLTQKHMAGRLADSLLYLSDEVFKKKKFELIVSKFELAELCGMSKDSVVRNLKQLSNDGFIKIEENHIEILDSEMLRHISKTGYMNLNV